MSKEDSVFGLEKKQKVAVIVFGILAVLFLIVYLITGMFADKEPEVFLPKGNLSASIFDAQNMTHTAVVGYDVAFELPNIPFKVDIPNSKKAVVGDATIVENGSYYFYYNVVPENRTTPAALASDLTTIISIGANEAETVSEELYSEKGFINGCQCQFSLYAISVKGMTEPYYVCLYRLRVDESIYSTDKDILIGCMAAGFNTDNLSNLQALASAGVGTLTYDEKYRERLEMQ